jgi:hypothetical protein
MSEARPYKTKLVRYLLWKRPYEAKSVGFGIQCKILKTRRSDETLFEDLHFDSGSDGVGVFVFLKDKERSRQFINA